MTPHRMPTEPAADCSGIRDTPRPCTLRSMHRPATPRRPRRITPRIHRADLLPALELLGGIRRRTFAQVLLDLLGARALRAPVAVPLGAGHAGAVRIHRLQKRIQPTAGAVAGRLAGLDVA